MFDNGGYRLSYYELVLLLLRELFLLLSLHFTLLARKILWEFVEGAQKELEVKSVKYFMLFILF